LTAGEDPIRLALVTGLVVTDPAARESRRLLGRFSAPELTPGLWVALWSAGAAAMLVVLAGNLLGDEDVPGYRLVFRLVGGAYVACGLIAWRRRPDSYSGLLMTATGFLLFVEPLFMQFDSPVVQTIGELFEDVWSITIIWLVLTLLSGGRLQTTADRVLVGAFVLEFVLEVAWHLFLVQDGNFLLVHADDGIADAILGANQLLVTFGCLGTAAVIGIRWKRANAPRRRALLPSVLGIASLLFFAVAQTAGTLAIAWLAILSLLMIPAGFLVGLLHSRLARGGLADRFRELLSLRGEALEAALARTLGDPDLAVVYADDSGRVVAPAEEDKRVVRIEREGREIAALVYDAALDDDPELVEAVTAAATIALENELLHEESAARLVELQASRERIVTAGDTERRRLERNLHDGAQQRLVALAMQLRLLEFQIQDDPEAAERLVKTASEELALSLGELRELARGIHPAVLDHGLEPALQALAGQATVPTSVRYEHSEALPETVELAAYFVASEALANVAKYAQARRADVHVTRKNGDIVIEISDDGVGGADSTLGSGLRGLADRVEALDGKLRVLSPPGHGTIVRAELPCGS
jgi:signal transduction histidine kinase